MVKDTACSFQKYACFTGMFSLQSVEYVCALAAGNQLYIIFDVVDYTPAIVCPIPWSSHRHNADAMK